MQLMPTKSLKIPYEVLDLPGKICIFFFGKIWKEESPKIFSVSFCSPFAAEFDSLFFKNLFLLECKKALYSFHFLLHVQALESHQLHSTLASWMLGLQSPARSFTTGSPWQM